MMHAVEILPLIVVAAISAIAVLHQCFNDNLMQRIGLSLICVGATIRLAQILFESSTTKESSTVLFYGLAAYGVGTLLKFRKLHKNDPLN